MLTATIVHGALVNIREEYGRESGPLDGFVGMELNPQSIAIGGGGGRDGTAAEGSNPFKPVLRQLGVDGNRIVSAVRLLMRRPLQVEVGEVERNLVRRRGNNLPNTLL